MIRLTNRINYVVAFPAIGAVLAIHANYSQAQSLEVRATMVENCLTSTGPDDAPGAESLAAIVGPILANITGSLVDTGVAALKKATNPDVMTMGGSFLQQGIYRWDPPNEEALKTQPDLKGKVRLNPTIGCVVIAVGDFNSNGNSDWELPFKVPANKKTTALASLKSELGLTAPPALLFEAAFKTSEDRSAVTWRPRRIYVSKFLNSSFFAGSSRALQISFSITKPGSDKPIYTQEFKFDDVKKGFNRLDKELDGAEQGTWGVLPANVKDKPAGKPSRSTSLDPFTLTAQIAETPKPYKLAQAFSGAVESNKDAIKTEFSVLVDPTKKDAAEKAAATAVLTAKDASVTAVQSYLDAWKLASDSCASSKVADVMGKLSCKLALDKAGVAKAKADATCSTTDTQACTEMAGLVLPPPPKP